MIRLRRYTKTSCILYTCDIGECVEFFLDNNPSNRAREISAHLDSVLFEDREMTQDSSKGRDGQEVMSLLDKMTLWSAKSVEDVQFPTESDDLFDGVEDESDLELTEQMDLPTHYKLILESSAYKWFIENLKKEISLRWSTKQPRIMIDIRNRILNGLPTGVISKRRPPKTHEVKFHVQMDIKELQVRKYHARYNGTAFPLFSDRFSITGDADEAQILTVRQYMSQTWPSAGIDILDLIEKVLDSFDADRSYGKSMNKIAYEILGAIFTNEHGLVESFENRRLEAQLITTNENQLQITATGPAYFLAQCAEQLSWLSAATYSPDTPTSGRCYPLIKKYRVEPAGSLTSSDRQTYCEVGLNFVPFELSNSGSEIPPTDGSPVQLDSKNKIIVGYPIANRPKHYPGLEMDYNTMIHCANINEIMTLHESIKLYNHCGKIFQWHSHSPELTSNKCCNKNNQLNYSAAVLGIDRLQDSRHIVSYFVSYQSAELGGKRRSPVIR
jgi:hypothetical protein